MSTQETDTEPERGTGSDTEESTTGRSMADPNPDPDSDEVGPITFEEGERTDGDDLDRIELAARLEVLAEENRRLREEYVRARQSRYRRTALGLAALGVLAGLAGLVLPAGRDVLLALAGTGLFGGVLTYSLTPARLVSADVGDYVYAASAVNGAALVDELGLRGDRFYVPRSDVPARLFVPQRASAAFPEARAGPIVTDEDARGLLLEATGAGLIGEFERTLTRDLATGPVTLAAQLTDGLVEGFELVDQARPDVDLERERVTVAITGSAFGDVDRFDHPIASFLAVGFATGLERPVALEVEPGGDRSDWLVTCRWGLEERAAA